MKVFHFLLLIIVLVFGQACNHGRISNLNDYYRWLNDKDNGMTKSEIVGSIKYTVKFLPSDFLALKDSINHVGSFEELSRSYRTGKYFLLTMEYVPIQNTVNTDINFKDVTTIEQYNDRIRDLNFYS